MSLHRLPVFVGLYRPLRGFMVAECLNEILTAAREPRPDEHLDLDSEYEFFRRVRGSKLDE